MKRCQSAAGAAHGEWGVTRLHASAARYDFRQNDGDEPDGVGVGLPCPGGAPRCGPAGVDERDYRDRDGVGVVAGVQHTFPLRDGQTQLRTGTDNVAPVNYEQFEQPTVWRSPRASISCMQSRAAP